MKPLVVIAIGGNSLITDSEHMTVVDQYRAAGETAHYIVPIIKAGYRVLVTHGNGPQIGNFLLRNTAAAGAVYPLPMVVASLLNSRSHREAWENLPDIELISYD